MMKLTQKHRWMLTAGAAGFLASRLTDSALASSWRRTAGTEPPDDPTHREVNWRSALLWSAAAGAIVAMSDVAARHGAAVLWKRVTGRKPPRRRPARHR